MRLRAEGCRETSAGAELGAMEADHGRLQGTAKELQFVSWYLSCPPWGVQSVPGDKPDVAFYSKHLSFEMEKFLQILASLIHSKQNETADK